MSQELTPHQGGAAQPALPMNMQEKINYARALADASLLPKAYQRNPGNVLLATELGESLGIPTIQAINQVHVIEGKPSASAALISMLVRRAGHRLRVVGDDQSATAEITRSDDPEFTYRVVWDMQRARNAKVTGKDNWQKYPAAMLKARAITEVARDACQEALMGVQYTPDELGAVTDGDGQVLESQAPRQVQTVRRAPRRQGPPPALPDVSRTPAPEPAAGDEAEADGDGVVMSDRAQWMRLGAALDANGYEERAAKGEAIQAWVAEQGITRKVENSAGLTSDEIEAFIAELTTDAEQPDGGGDGDAKSLDWDTAPVPQ